MVSDRRTDSRRGWVVVAILAVTVTVSYGVLTYSFGVMLVPMQHELRISRVALTGAFSVALLVWALVGLPLGMLLDRYSPRVPMVTGAALGVLFVLAWSQVRSATELYLIFAGLGVAMAALLYNSAFAVATMWFQESRRQAITVISFAGAFASLIFSPLTGRLILDFGWRSALVILAAMMATTIPLLALVRAPDTARAAGKPRWLVGTNRFGALRSRRFWLMAVALSLGSFSWSAVVVQLVPLLLDEGRSIGFATFAAGIVGIAQLPGRLAFALFGGTLAGGRAPLASSLLAAVALLILAAARSEFWLLTSVTLFGMSAGLLTLVSANAPAELFARQDYGIVLGATYACSNLARAAAPFLSAAIALLPGNYLTLLISLAVLNGLAGFLGAAAFRGLRMPGPAPSVITL